MGFWQKRAEDVRHTARQRMVLDSRMEVLKHCPRIRREVQKEKWRICN